MHFASLNPMEIIENLLEPTAAIKRVSLGRCYYPNSMSYVWCSSSPLSASASLVITSTLPTFDDELQ